jgi:hypothetical protein
MKKFLAVISAGLIAISVAVAQNVAPPPGPPKAPPVIKTDGELRPVLPPTNGRQVAVVNIQLNIENGEVISARIVSSKRVNSIAPKVFARQSGDWVVTIEGDRTKSFFVANPAYLEAETREGSKNPYTYVAEDGVLDWSLVVPLYADGEPLGAKSITIHDRRSEQIILRGAI